MPADNIIMPNILMNARKIRSFQIAAQSLLAEADHDIPLHLLDDTAKQTIVAANIIRQIAEQPLDDLPKIGISKVVGAWAIQHVNKMSGNTKSDSVNAFASALGLNMTRKYNVADDVDLFVVRQAIDKVKESPSARFGIGL